MFHNWQAQEVDKEFSQEVKEKFALSSVVSNVLSSRFSCLTEIEKFIFPKIKDNMQDPYILSDMEKAVDIVIEAILQKQKIAILGDYDVDGGTSSALLKKYFSLLKKEVIIYIPDREKEGYGPNKQAFDFFQKESIDLVITVDCGASSFEVLEYAKNLNIKIIVMDHHIANGKKPCADAVVNPNHNEEKGEYKYLAAVGVCFLFLVALQRKLRGMGGFARVDPLPKSKILSYNEKKHRSFSVLTPPQGGGFSLGVKEPNLLEFLDIVALGTVCDIVPLVELNRAFVKLGLDILKKKKNVGLTSLGNVANLEWDSVYAYHFGFILGPRINAGGRVGDSYLGANLLSCDDESESMDIALKLEKYNAERKAIEEICLDEIYCIIEEQELNLNPVIIVASHNLHIGVIGIAASRVKDKYGKPVIIITIDEDGLGKASCRSISGVDIGGVIIDAKEKDILLAGGGHKMAAGFSIIMGKLEDFKKFVFTELTEQVTKSLENKKVNYDLELSISSLNIDLHNQLKILEPYGVGNPEPKFLLKDCKIGYSKILAEKHLKLVLNEFSGGLNGARIEAILWKAIDSEYLPLIEKNIRGKFSFIGKLKANSWNGVTKPQFEIVAVRVEEK